MLTVKIIDDVQSWSKDRAAFDQLAGDYFTRRYAWLTAWWHAYRNDGTQLHILKVSDADRIVGFLPLCIINRNGSQDLVLLGSGKACSDDLGLYAQAGLESEVAQAAVSTLYQAGANGNWDRLHLEGVRNNCPAMNQLLLCLRSTFGADMYEQVDQPCRVLNLGRSMDDYFASISSNQRKNLRKLHREYNLAGRVTNKFASNIQDAKEALIRVSMLHQARWESKGESGCIATVGFSDFLDRACSNLFDDKQWFSILTYVDGQLAGGAIGAQCGDSLCIYMTGMDPSQAEHRPGLLMNLSCIEYAIGRGLQRYDLMRGDEEYKSRLGASPVSQFVWSGAAPRIFPRLRSRFEYSKFAMKQWLKDFKVQNQQ
jgi:CelD/BcsL family acetyltransferase involved in cellulose biosynthesis